METQTESLIEKIKGLPPDKISEVEEFVDFLSQRTLQQVRRARHEAIAAYATQFAGTEADLIEDLENASAEQACWIAQPNFEVVVYLDQASPRQLGFIERTGVRQKAKGAIATYRLTRESIYTALEGGLQTGELLQTPGGSSHPLPPGVARTLGDWAARRERLTVRLDAWVLEFPDPAARDEALASGRIKGTAIGDRFVMPEQTESSLKRALPSFQTISYEPEPPRSVGQRRRQVAILPNQRDLLIEGELATIAEPTQDSLCWRITRSSVEAARSRGLTADEIIERLERRVTGVVIPLFYTMQSWAGAGIGKSPARHRSPLFPCRRPRTPR